MIRKMNRAFKAFLRKKRIAFGRLFWDKANGNAVIDSDHLISDNHIGSILFIRADGKVGDMVVSTFMFRELKKVFFGLKIGVVTKGSAKDIIANDTNVDVIYDYPNDKKSIKDLATTIKAEKYDMIVEFYEEIKVKEMMFIKLCGARINMGLNKAGWPLFNISIDGGIDIDMCEHISRRYKAYLIKMGLDKDSIDMSYDICFDKKRNAIIEKMEKALNDGKTIVLNPYGASKHRSFHRETIIKILDELKDKRVILLYNGDKYREIKSIAKKYHNVIVPDGIKSIMDSAMYIKVSDLVISPDTSIIHIAAAFNVDIIGVYEYDGGILGSGHIVWGPDRTNATLVFAGHRKSTYDDFDLNDFDFAEMKEKIEEALDE